MISIMQNLSNSDARKMKIMFLLQPRKIPCTDVRAIHGVVQILCYVWLVAVHGHDFVHPFLSLKIFSK